MMLCEKVLESALRYQQDLVIPVEDFKTCAAQLNARVEYDEDMRAYFTVGVARGRRVRITAEG